MAAFATWFEGNKGGINSLNQISPEWLSLRSAVPETLEIDGQNPMLPFQSFEVAVDWGIKFADSEDGRGYARHPMEIMTFTSAQERKKIGDDVLSLGCMAYELLGGVRGWYEFSERIPFRQERAIHRVDWFPGSIAERIGGVGALQRIPTELVMRMPDGGAMVQFLPDLFDTRPVEKVEGFDWKTIQRKLGLPNDLFETVALS